jgi:hypothetical protein
MVLSQKKKKHIISSFSCRCKSNCDLYEVSKHFIDRLFYRNIMLFPKNFVSCGFVCQSKRKKNTNVVKNMENHKYLNKTKLLNTHHVF